MAQYTATSVGTRSLQLFDYRQLFLAELIYPKWYSFHATIQMPQQKSYQLVLSGFWQSTIQLKDEDQVLLEFSLEWKGILFRMLNDAHQRQYLLKLKSFTSGQYIMQDLSANELFTITFDFKWRQLKFDYRIESTLTFERLDQKELILLSALHAVNYYRTIVAAT